MMHNIEIVVIEFSDATFVGATSDQTALVAYQFMYA